MQGAIDGDADAEVLVGRSGFAAAAERDEQRNRGGD